MSFLNWKRFIIKSFASRTRDYGIDLGKSFHTGINAAGSFHKRNSLHSASPINHHKTSSLFSSSPLSPLSPRHNLYFSSRKTW